MPLSKDDEELANRVAQDIARRLRGMLDEHEEHVREALDQQAERISQLATALERVNYWGDRVADMHAVLLRNVKDQGLQELLVEFRGRFDGILDRGYRADEAHRQQRGVGHAGTTRTENPGPIDDLLTGVRHGSFRS